MTEEDRILEKGKTSVDVPGIAAELGTGGNILAGKIDTLVSTVAGISTVTNSSNFSGGMAEESDTSLRKRILESFINTSNGANAKFYKDFALKYDQVSFANTEYQAGNNVLKLYISDYFRMVDSDLVTQLQNDIQAEKELNVNVQVAAATPVTQNIEATIYVTETRNTSRKQSAAVSYLMQKIYELGIGESFNPYSIAHDITDQIGDVLAISFEQPSTMVEISSGTDHRAGYDQYQCGMSVALRERKGHQDECLSAYVYSAKNNRALPLGQYHNCRSGDEGLCGCDVPATGTDPGDPGKWFF